MAHITLRTRLLIATVLIIFALTGAILLIIRHTVRAEIQRQVREGTQESTRTFESVQRQREFQLSRTAAILAELPTLKALMTTEHALTIQDGSTMFWKLAGSDLFLLAKPDRQVVAFNMNQSGWTTTVAQERLLRSVDLAEDASWWSDDGLLYRVFLQPITAGSDKNTRQLGILVIGYQVDTTVAQQLAVVTGTEIALTAGDRIIASTLPLTDETQLRSILASGTLLSNQEREELTLPGGQYAFASVALQQQSSAPVQCYVLLPLAPVKSFLRRLNRTIFVLGAATVVLATLLFGFVARTITRPLDNLVAGVRALAAGDFDYSVTRNGSSEVVELSTAFAQMRDQLHVSQQQRIEAERIEALARAASSISHDLRHYLATVVANAEFLYEPDGLRVNKDEIYQEIRSASTQMTDLIDSLRELSYQRSTISPMLADLAQVIRRAIDAIHAKFEFRNVPIALRSEDRLEGVFDPRKLERVIFNLLLNACEAASEIDAKISVDVLVKDDAFEIRVTDNGLGVPDAVQNTLFDPFVSFGKPNGTGLGLAIVSKIVQDHGGSARVESSSRNGTVIFVTLPRAQKSTPSSTEATMALPPSSQRD